MTLWSGRVEGKLAQEVWDFLRADDTELLPYDIEGTRLHARRLGAAGILTADEVATAEAGLSAITIADITEDDEDCHSAIERILGDVGKKIHAGRSRNDQVATAFRLYVVDACRAAQEAVRELALVILDRAEPEAATPMPGYTHLQRAQPVTVGHHLHAWVEMLERDLQRFAFAQGQAAVTPLGAGALAGSTLGLPPAEGVESMRNSLDAVADRDFAVDYLYACAACHGHLSRIGEELILWATSEFAFIKLGHTSATGSSMMPQKLNPDVAELARGKAGTALGRLVGLLALVKGLPLTYNRDLQDDKPGVFAARKDLRGTVAALAVMIHGMELQRDRMAAAAADPLLLATDAAEALVEAGTPFRQAHEIVASAVRDGSYVAPVGRARPAPGPGGAAAAIAVARARLTS